MANFVDKFITFIMVLTNIVIYLLEDIYKFFLPHKCCQKNVLGKTVLVTGAGLLMLYFNLPGMDILLCSTSL